MAPLPKIGYNFSISAGVIIGQAKERAPEIGNNVMLMVNTSVLGASICDNVAIGAGGLVIKDIDDEFTVWAGSPAKKGFVNGMVASHLLCHSGTINRHSLNGALLS
ncbi:LbetaH domain-containing protein [Klebsiella pneumoniae]|uniref:hypothetical protein n=1 Tax=Klebsiella pneumoniae TaxID=573 RepID=UPI00115F13E9|nr:hypothetical protein [Klebsiella pneumoniae]